MTRLRPKGGASPETLFEGTNCYVTASKSLKQRPAVRAQTTAAAASKGMCSFGGVLYTFAASAVSNPGSTTQLVLIHPTPGFAGTLKKIHFAKPYMGKLYICAEFSDGTVADYWLQTPPAWQQFHVYDSNEIVQPTVPNGFYYLAFVAHLPPAWQANFQYNLGDLIQPTVYDGYYFTAQTMLPNALGPTASGSVEPNWNASAGALTVESSAGNSGTAPTPPTQPPTVPQGRGDGGWYTNPAGTGGRLGSFANPSPRTP